jgi:hypothetical protein
MCLKKNELINSYYIQRIRRSGKYKSKAYKVVKIRNLGHPAHTLTSCRDPDFVYTPASTVKSDRNSIHNNMEDDSSLIEYDKGIHVFINREDAEDLLRLINEPPSEVKHTILEVEVEISKFVAAGTVWFGGASYDYEEAIFTEVYVPERAYTEAIKNAYI